MNAIDFLKLRRIYDDDTLYNADDEMVGTISELMEEYAEQQLKNCNLQNVSVSLPSYDLKKEWAECKKELELKGNASEMGTYFAMFMHGWRGRNSEGFWQ